MNRRPLIRSLENVHEQLRQIIILGRPSTKRFIFTSGILAQIRAMEAGRDPRTPVLDALKDGLGESVGLLRETGNSANVLTPALTDDSNLFSLDYMGWFGFDFSSLVGSFALAMLTSILI